MYHRPPGPTPEDLYDRHQRRKEAAYRAVLSLAFRGRRPFQPPTRTPLP